MAVVAQVILRGVSPEDYDRVRAEVGWLVDQPTGGRAHVAWWEGDDNHNIDVWDDAAAFEAFGQDRLGPAMAKLGINSEPEVSFHEAYEVHLPEAITLT